MTANVYATLAEFQAQLETVSTAPADDVYIESLLERASREFDGDTGHWFYAYTQTRYFTVPQGRELELDAPLLGVTTLANGDETAIVADDYRLYPLNGPNRASLKLRPSSTVVWDYGTDGDGLISVTGTWGYVDRDATDPESLTVISNSKTAVLALALAVYRKRYGVGVEGVATITGAGVVITPRDKSREYWALVSLYRRVL